MQTLLEEKSLKLLLNGKCCCKLANVLVKQAGCGSKRDKRYDSTGLLTDK
jgi:hypothetical protein